MTIYKFMYKCRLCGEIYSNNSTKDEQLVINSLLKLIGIEVGGRTTFQPEKHEIHFCKNGSRGMADILGAKKEEE